MICGAHGAGAPAGADECCAQELDLQQELDGRPVLACIRDSIKHLIKDARLQSRHYGDHSGEEDTGHCSAARVIEPLPTRWHGRDPAFTHYVVRMPTVVDSSSRSVVPVVLVAPTQAGYYTIAPSFVLIAS